MDSSSLNIGSNMLRDKSGRTPSEFDYRVYDCLRTVPAGRVTTYGNLARYIGCGSAQAVGQALRRNPFAPEVPCHRVIAADLSPGGFTGQRKGPALQRKLRLLAQEGVFFEMARGRLRLRDQRALYRFARPHGRK